jgi:predicted TIM-barrel fold metal-dependent hydrolase
MDDPAAARNELSRLADKGLRHFNVLAARADPPVYDVAWEPFWELAEAVDIPIGFHLVVEVRRARRDEAPSANPIVAGAARAATATQGYQLIEPIAGLILTGVLDRYPRLRLVMAEAGLAWVPHMIQSLDWYAKRLASGRSPAADGQPVQLPALRPSEYFPRQIWVTFQDDAFGLQMLHLLGEDRVMWASDYPHPASTWPFSQQVIEAQMRGVTPAARQKVLCDNARVLYGL